MNIDEVFKSASRVILKKEIGSLNDNNEFLSKYTSKLNVAASASGKQVYYTAPYCKNAGFVSFEEAFKHPAADPVDVNDIKDVDSLLNAVGEKICYAGNKVLGNSKFVEESEGVIDSTMVYRSSEILRCEYMAYSCLLRDSKYLFGCASGGESSFCINCGAVNNTQRCFESMLAVRCADAYYCNNCDNCQDVFFCFDQKNIRKAVGNNELASEKYAQLKQHLLEQITNDLERKKLPSLVDFV